MKQLKLSKTSPPQNQTMDFFDRIAVEYDKKYGSQDAFYSYFFWQRIFEATSGFDFSNKSILDVGCGSGRLYKFLKSKFSDISFSGTDISSNMISLSEIPYKSRYVGNLYQLDLGENLFDFIFMLGVSSYMQEDELRKNFRCIRTLLRKDGRFVVSFTNKGSLDLRLRNLSSQPVRWLKKDNKVMGQDFRVQAYNLSDIKSMMEGFYVEEVKWLNQTIFPFSKLFPKWSVKVADAVKRNSNEKMLNTLSSDFLLVCKLK